MHQLYGGFLSHGGTTCYLWMGFFHEINQAFLDIPMTSWKAPNPSELTKWRCRVHSRCYSQTWRTREPAVAKYGFSMLEEIREIRISSWLDDGKPSFGWCSSSSSHHGDGYEPCNNGNIIWLNYNDSAKYKYVYKYVYRYVYVCIYVYVYISMYMCVFMYLYMYLCIHTCICIHMYPYMYMYTYVYLYVSMYLCICIYIYIYLCTCIYICICVSMYI